MDYTDDLIGSWVARFERKAHLIQSVVAGEPITKCGRRLVTEGWEIVAYPSPWAMPPLRFYCRQCNVQ